MGGVYGLGTAAAVSGNGPASRSAFYQLLKDTEGTARHLYVALHSTVVTRITLQKHPKGTGQIQRGDAPWVRTVWEAF